VAKAQLALADRELRAPFSGIIGKLDLKKGRIHSAGTTVATLADLSEWQIETTDLTDTIARDTDFTCFHDEPEFQLLIKKLS